MARISTKNQITIPVAVLEEAGLRAGEAVGVEPAGDGELRVRRAALTFADAFGALTGAYPPGYLDRLDAQDAERWGRLLDADVLIGALDGGDAHHARARRLLTGWRRRQDRVSVSVVNLSEVLIAPAADPARSARADPIAAATLAALAVPAPAPLAAHAHEAGVLLAGRGVTHPAVARIGTLSVDSAVAGADEDAEMIAAVLARPGSRDRQVPAIGIDVAEDALIECMLTPPLPRREAERLLRKPTDGPDLPPLASLATEGPAAGSGVGEVGLRSAGEVFVGPRQRAVG